MKLRVMETAFDELCKALLVPLLAFLIVVLRGWYSGRKRWPARIVEGVIFAVIASIIHPVVLYLFVTRMNFPHDIADRSALMFVCALGYIGADTLSDAANNYFGGRR